MSEITICNIKTIKEESTGECVQVNDNNESREIEVEIFDRNTGNEHVKLEITGQDSEMETDQDIELDNSYVMKCEIEEEELTKSVVEQPTLVRKATSCVLSFSRLYIFDVWHSTPGIYAEKQRHIIGHMTNSSFNSENYNTEELEKQLKYICSKLINHWKKYNRNRKRVMSTQWNWLNVTERFELQKKDIQKSLSSRDKPQGRPKKNFEECSKSTQSRRKAMLSKVDESAITALVKASEKRTLQNLEPNDALALMKVAKLTKRQYLLIRKIVNEKLSSSIFPSYTSIIKYDDKVALGNLK